MLASPCVLVGVEKKSEVTPLLNGGISNLGNPEMLKGSVSEDPPVDHGGTGGVVLPTADGCGNTADGANAGNEAPGAVGETAGKDGVGLRPPSGIVAEGAAAGKDGVGLSAPIAGLEAAKDPVAMAEGAAAGKDFVGLKPPVAIAEGAAAGKEANGLKPPVDMAGLEAAIEAVGLMPPATPSEPKLPPLAPKSWLHVLGGGGPYTDPEGWCCGGATKEEAGLVGATSCGAAGATTDPDGG